MKGLFCFLTGAAIGAIGTFLYFQKFVVPEIKADILKNEEEKQQAVVNKIINAGINPFDVLKNGEKKEEELVISDYATRTEKTQKVLVDYTNYSRDPETATITVKEEPKEEADKENYGTPYLIDPDSFDEFSPSYTAHAFVIFSDGVVIDDETEEILDEDPELVFGKTAMDELDKGDIDIVYIRNDEKKQDYSLERRDYPFDGPSGNYIPVLDPDDWRE